jgi:hypothetical protein
MATHEHSVELAGVNLAGRNHVCAFFNTIDEEHRVLGSFYKDGIDRGEKAAYIVDPEDREEHLKRLAEAGIDVQKIMDTGQLEVVPWTDVYVRDHRFDQDAMLAAVEKLIQSGHRCRLPTYQVSGTSYGLAVSRQTCHVQPGGIRGTTQSRSFQVRRSGDL